MGGALHHVGLVVADLERSLGFYRDVIGLAPLGRGMESDPRYAEMLGVPEARFAWAELDLGDGHVLELLRFDEPAGRAAGGAVPAPPAALPGVAHFGIRVDDIEAVHAAVVKSGARAVSRPIELVEENEWLGSRVFYALDPDGHLVELVQARPPVG